MRIDFLMEGEVYSFARVMGFMLIVYWMVFASREAMLSPTGKLPDIPFGIITLVLLAYGIGKGGEVIIANNQSKTTISNAEHKE